MTADGGGASVSVVIATHNRPQLLAKAVAAAVEQVYDGPVEVIAVFDQTTPQMNLQRADGHR